MSIFFSFLFHFSMEFVKANRTAPDGTRRHILGYSVCPCPIKRMPGVYGLKKKFSYLWFQGFITFYRINIFAYSFRRSSTTKTKFYFSKCPCFTFIDTFSVDSSRTYTVMLTSPCNVDHVTSHFYIVKLGFTWVPIFLFLLLNIDRRYSLEPHQ